MNYTWHCLLAHSTLPTLARSALCPTFASYLPTLIFVPSAKLELIQWQFKPCTWLNPRAFGPQQLQSPFVRSLHTSPARRAKKTKTKTKTLFCCENYFIPHLRKSFQLHENILPLLLQKCIGTKESVRSESQTVLILSSKAGLKRAMEHNVFIFKTSLVEEKNRRQSSPYSKRSYANAHCFQINNFLETNVTFTGFYFKLENDRWTVEASLFSVNVNFYSKITCFKLKLFPWSFSSFQQQE